MMPAYNAGTYIRQAIQSVLDQSYTNWELVIIDDGSTDQTNAIVSGYIDSRIKVVRQENRGEATARNNALRNIQGEYLACLDSDDIYLPQHLEVMVKLKINQVHLNPGLYTLGLWVADPPLEVYDYIPSAALFEVVETEKEKIRVQADGLIPVKFSLTEVG
jgi:glycosyltransferase involved in cell wall biosynthesis